jgi:integrase
MSLNQLDFLRDLVFSTSSFVAKGFDTMALASPLHRPHRLHLGHHHFAYLRAIAESLPVVEAARRYLNITHAAQALTAHRTVIDHLRAIARRRGDARWRLIGIEIREPLRLSDPTMPTPPTLQEWVASEGLGDWSIHELALLYAERFGRVDADTDRRQTRNARLRQERLAILRELEAFAVVRAVPTDAVEGWLPIPIARSLSAAGILTLGDLKQRIDQAGRWWSDLPACGPIKAARLAGFIDGLLGDKETVWPVQPVSTDTKALSGAHGANRMVNGKGGTEAQDDRQAIDAWIAARAGSVNTAKGYAREAERFVLFCVMVRHKALSDANAEDCRAYMDFLAAVPPHWIGRAHVARHTPGWRPFKRQLSLASRKLSITVVTSLCEWLVQAQYLRANPWILINRRLGDDADSPEWATGGQGESRAFTKGAWQQLQHTLATTTQDASTARLSWICTFVEATGLRSAELLRATRGHFLHSADGWMIRVHGKGRKNRTVPVPKRAIDATQRYFKQRGLAFNDAPLSTPLVAALDDPMQPISYRALYETFTRFVKRALANSLPEQAQQQGTQQAVQQAHAMRASMHWLRHTHATRAAERNVPLDVLQENLGQTDPRTTAHYYRAQIQRRQKEMERAFALD